MDRKGIIGLICAVIGFVAWQYYYVSASHEALRAQREAAAAAAATQPIEPASAPATPAPGPATPSATAAAPSAPPTDPAVEEKQEKLSTSTVEYLFTNLGGGIARAMLLDHQAEEGRKVTLNEFGSMPIGAISEVAGSGTAQPFAVRQDAPLAITFERTDTRQIETRKTFILPKLDGLQPKEKLRDEYLVRLELTFANRAAQAVQLPGYFIHTGAAAPIHRLDQPMYTGFNWFRGGGNKFVDVNWFSGGGFLFFSRPERPVYAETHEKIRWAGVTNQYFTSLVAPEVDAKAPADVQARQLGATNVWSTRFTVAPEAWKAAGHATENGAVPRHGVVGALGMPGFTLQPGQSVTQPFSLYVGPREYRRLAALGNEQEEVMDFGMFGIVSKTLLTSMNWLRSWLGNYAWAIVVLTLIIKTLMWPLQNKATNSMKRMALLQPKMTELREKYKDDPTRMNAELMKLYKDYKINPMSGCLPMLVQIPIFFGFYNMLGKAVELRNSKFLWVDDLSQPDTIFHIPGIGIPINPLPLLMAVTMFWQMAISPKSGDPVQQRVFMFVPLIFIFFCYNFASALALYWTVQNLFSVAQLYATRNQAPPELVKVTPPPKKKSRA